MTGGYDNSGSGPRAGLSRERLAQLISAYGGNPRRWPREVRKPELRDIGMDAELREQLAAEGALDEALDLIPAVEIPDRLRERLLASFERVQKEERSRFTGRVARGVSSLRDFVWPGASWWQPACALSLSVLIGLSVGLLLPDSLSDSGDQQLTNISDTPGSVDVEQGL